jgi:hypothetical protein
MFFLRAIFRMRSAIEATGLTFVYSRICLTIGHHRHTYKRGNIRK